MTEKLDEWKIPYRVRLASDIGPPFARIRDAIWDHKADQIKGARCEQGRNDFLTFSRSTIIDLFGRGEAGPVDANATFYAERVGVYANNATTTEAWQAAIDEMTPHLESFGVDRNAPGEIVYERFRVGRGTVKVAIVQRVSSVFVVVYRSETRLGIKLDLPALPSFLSGRFRSFDGLSCAEAR